MEDDGPQLVRPIPRRPFDVSQIGPALSDYEDEPIPHHELLTSRLLQLANESPSVSSPPSCMNLTSSTLAGIYSPDESDAERRFLDGDNADDEGEDEDEDDLEVVTPLEMASRTPLRRFSHGNSLHDHSEKRSHAIPRRSSVFSNSAMEAQSESATEPTVLSWILRATLLFCLGAGYGVLVARLHTEGHFAPLAEGILIPGYNWQYLTFWGATGVLLGALLPWFDRAWEDGFENSAEHVSRFRDSKMEVEEDEQEEPSKAGIPSMDWALVIRAVGAFVGIAFAIRRLAWDSTLQVSATLTLVNPLLWWLIDRSKTGFILSAGVGLTGSVLLLGVNPDMVPAPSALSFGNSSASYSMTAELPAATGTPTSTMETGIWILSVLFCSCLCFGNIGRRLTQSKSAVSKGRWGGLR
ncbi:insulin-induced protein-domain-containing protein [Stachybotrys elegans]|uniref:Insulin-induced protein-domain-containing protein n=1 Tax=Stachybotrys elegans TaxID=80388 RepID=A0A8K0WWC8_9HYPO|nr:insulin-induced protein-domain-containing protein [Stachybotrys elegans]